MGKRFTSFLHLNFCTLYPADFDEIWSFIEFKLQTPVPPYIKYILMFCGYNNGISISTIEDVDVQHFVDVVKNGSVTDYFGEKNILQGSMRSIDNFEFSRGHVKFLMYIVSFLREYIEENGHSFSMEISTNSGIKRQVQKTLFPLRKRFKRQHTFDHSKENFEDSIKQEDILLNKAIMTVVTYAPKNYVKVSVIKMWNSTCGSFCFVWKIFFQHIYYAYTGLFD